MGAVPFESVTMSEAVLVWMRPRTSGSAADGSAPESARRSSDQKASRVPSGDQVGRMSSPGPETKKRGSLPSGSATQISPSASPTWHPKMSDNRPNPIVDRATADARSWTYDYVAAWMTLRVHSSLAAIGLTAAVSRALADQGISCNVLSGYFHDHLLVPVERASDAMAALHRLSAGSSSSISSSVIRVRLTPARGRVRQWLGRGPGGQLVGRASSPPAYGDIVRPTAALQPNT